ncbi:MAG: hypothetical protein JNL11_10820 [Bdellovibrionaceae bacterium]|nr:hypothetical protein [Pseudobdellovibrionaceae bacterium]
MDREIASIDYSSVTHVLTIVFQDGTFIQERDVLSEKEARLFIEAKFKNSKIELPKKEVFEKKSRHLSLC